MAAGVLENLPQILQVLSQEQRDKYIELFIQAQNKVEKANKSQWRQREQFAIQISELCALISADKLNQFYVPKFYDLCLDDVATVRETTATMATASIVKNFLSSNNLFFLDNFINEMTFFQSSRTFTHRQTFICMIKSLILDFCSIDTSEKAAPGSDLNLIDSIVIKYFEKGLLDLSQDKVVNVRISLAECFYSVQIRMEELEQEAQRIQKQVNALRLKDKEVNESDLRYLTKYRAIRDEIGLYLNKNFFQLIVNLK